MTGPEHYREAERLLSDSLLPSGLDYVESEGDGQTVNVAAAQVHATLALAAATIECATEHTDPDYRNVQGNYITQGANAKAWQEVL